MKEKVNLDRVYAKAIVEGWDEAISLAKEGLPFYDKEIEEDFLTIAQRLKRLKNPWTLGNSQVQVGRYEKCYCYEYFSKPELGILAPDPDCEACGGTGERFIPSSRESSYFMGINLREFWPEGIGETEMDRLIEVSLIEEMDKEYLEMEKEWDREIVQLYRKYRKEGIDPETAWDKAWKIALALNETDEDETEERESGGEGRLEFLT